jgi:hypothetical protein
MKLTFDFAHRNTVKTRSSIAGRPLSLSETVTLEIAEATTMDAPVAVSWDNGSQFTRWHDGRHFKAVEGESDASTLLSRLPPHSTEPVRGFTAGFMLYPTTDTLHIDDPKIEHFDERTRQRRLANVREWANSCLVVDGRMYMACAEPHYRVYPWGLIVATEWGAEDNPGFYEHRPNTIGKGDHLNSGSWFHTERFNLGRGEEAVAMAKLWHGKTVINPDSAGMVDILIPTSIGAPDDRPVLYEAADQLLNSLNHIEFRLIPPILLRGVQPMSELLWGREAREVNPDHLAETLDTARSALRIGDPEMRIVREPHVQRLDEALRRWFDAEISFDVSPTKGLNP